MDLMCAKKLAKSQLSQTNMTQKTVVHCGMYLTSYTYVTYDILCLKS